MDEGEKKIWEDNFYLMHSMRELVYLRCSIPVDALRQTASIYVVNDAAVPAMITAIYARYERPNQNWSCQQIFAKVLLSPVGKTLPKTELQALSNGSDLKEFVEVALEGWVKDVHVFTDNEIRLAWIAYETIKLNVFERNRAMNIKSKVELSQVLHIEGKSNPADVGIKDVMPGSIWMCGYPWMRRPLEEAIKIGTVKSIENIRLENDQKRILKQGITHDDFDDSGDFFAILSASKDDEVEIKKRMSASNFIVEPLGRHFAAVVRITAMVIKFKGNMRRNVRRRKQMSIEIYTTKFTPFFSVPEFLVKQKVVASKEREEFLEKWKLKIDKEVVLTETDLWRAIEYMFKRATIELKQFNNARRLDKIGVELDGILYSRNRIMEGHELEIMGELKGHVNLGPFSRVNFKTPLIDQHSSLGVSLAYHLHTLLNHRGTDSVHRLGMEYAQIINGKHIYRRIGQECVTCSKKKGRVPQTNDGAASQLTACGYASILLYTDGYLGTYNGILSRIREYDQEFQAI